MQLISETYRRSFWSQPWLKWGHLFAAWTLFALFFVSQLLISRAYKGRALDVGHTLIHVGDVLECVDGHAAVDVIRKEKPDLVFLDMQMPEMCGQSGAQYRYSRLLRLQLRNGSRVRFGPFIRRVSQPASTETFLVW